MDRVTLGNIYSMYKMYHLECKMQDDNKYGLHRIYKVNWLKRVTEIGLHRVT